MSSWDCCWMPQSARCRMWQLCCMRWSFPHGWISVFQLLILHGSHSFKFTLLWGGCHSDGVFFHCFDTCPMFIVQNLSGPPASLWIDVHDILDSSRPKFHGIAGHGKHCCLLFTTIVLLCCWAGAFFLSWVHLFDQRGSHFVTPRLILLSWLSHTKIILLHHTICLKSCAYYWIPY